MGLIGSGGEEVKEEVERLGRENIGVCPFVRVWGKMLPEKLGVSEYCALCIRASYHKR